MKKVKLEPEQLAVDSFRTTETDAGGERGTVHGQARCTYYYNCLADTGLYKCGTQPTVSCDYTGGTCEP